MWCNLARSYVHVARMSEMQGVLRDQQALLAQRRISAFSSAILECFKAYQTLPPGFWVQLHESYVDAEKWVARIRVVDPANPVWGAESVEEAYCTVLLVFLTRPLSHDTTTLP